MATETKVLKAALATAHEQLTAAGWAKTHSVMHGAGGLRYGSCYVKGGRAFYLNKDTVVAPACNQAIAADTLAKAR